MAVLLAPVTAPVENQPSTEPKPQRRPRFWIGPVVAGSCFALGFGVTQRLVALQGGEAPSVQQDFAAQRFPGERLQNLTTDPTDTTRPLMADVAAREAELAKTRPPAAKEPDAKAKQEAARLANEARLRRQRTAALRAPVVPAAAVTVTDEPESIPAPQLPPQDEVALPDAVPATPSPLAVESVRERPITPMVSSPTAAPTPSSAPFPLDVPTPAAPPLP